MVIVVSYLKSFGQNKHTELTAMQNLIKMTNKPHIIHINIYVPTSIHAQVAYTFYQPKIYIVNQFDN